MGLQFGTASYSSPQSKVDWKDSSGQPQHACSCLDLGIHFRKKNCFCNMSSMFIYYGLKSLSNLRNANANPMFGVACGRTVLTCVSASSNVLNWCGCRDRRYAIIIATERLDPFAQCTRHTFVCKLLPSLVLCLSSDSAGLFPDSSLLEDVLSSILWPSASSIALNESRQFRCGGQNRW